MSVTVGELKEWFDSCGFTDETVLWLDGDDALCGDVPGKPGIGYISLRDDDAPVEPSDAQATEEWFSVQGDDEFRRMFRALFRVPLGQAYIRTAVLAAFMRISLAHAWTQWGKDMLAKLEAAAEGKA